MASAGIVLCDSSELYNLLNQTSQYPCLSNPNYMLLLDTRKRSEFNESHIVTAKFAPRNDIGAFLVPDNAELETKVHVVIYDSNTNSLKDKGSSALSCAKLMWEMGSKNPVKVVKGGYEMFSAFYPFLRTQKMVYMPRELDEIVTYPLEVIPQFLYIGNIQQSQNKAIKKDLKVKAHINVSMETDNIFSKDTVILGKDEKKISPLLDIPIEDHSEADIFSHFQDIVSFIDDHNNEDSYTVLIYSTLGISRCITIAIAYIMWHKKISLKDAYNHLKKCKQNIQPSRGFIQQLAKWELQLFGKAITDIDETNY